MESSFCRSCVRQMASKKLITVKMEEMGAKRLKRDKCLVKMTSGIDAVPLDDELIYWQASVDGPDGSPYEGGKFFLFLRFPHHFPFKPPKVRFITKIIHPNVSRHGDLNIDILQGAWTPSMTISTLLISIQSVLTDPFTEICIEPQIGQLFSRCFGLGSMQWLKWYLLINFRLTNMLNA